MAVAITLMVMRGAWPNAHCKLTSAGSFVRAMVYNPEILILDEATSNVDSETEELVNRSIEHIMEGRTSIVIAHRLSTIQHADTIIVMHKGEIREMGSHLELIKQDEGIYRKLYELQYKDQLVEG